MIFATECYEILKKNISETGTELELHGYES
jgi:hypothetical protein